MLHPNETSGTRDLSTVTVVNFSHAPEVEIYRNQLLQSGGVEFLYESPEGLSRLVQQKIAVLFDEATKIETVQKATKVFEAFLNGNPGVSVRFFYLKWNEITEKSSRFTDLNGAMKDIGLEGILARFRIIDATKVAPYDLAIEVNRALYKSRLPLFLRKGYDIEITTELKIIDGIGYRPIIITKHQPSEIERALEYSGYRYIYSNESGNRWAYTVGKEGILKMCEWSQGIQNKALALNAQRTFSLYNEEYNRFYRIQSGGDISEISSEKTRAGKPDHRTVGLFVHSKRLFSLGPNGVLSEILENDFVMVQKCDSPSRGGPLPLSAFKTTEDEE